MKFSIIIPVYNVYNYLSECIESCLKQDHKEFEMICINDGSTDNSLQLLKQYSKQDSRIKIIDQNNQGLGAARNNGVKVANGDYIIFLDSDDWLETNMLGKINSVIEQYQPDILLAKANVNKNNITVRTMPKKVHSPK